MAEIDVPTLDEARAILTGPGAPFEMEDVVVHGRAVRAWKVIPRSLRSVLEHSRTHGERPFLVYEDERVTFADHFAHAATVSRRLVDEYGIAKGDRVAIAMRNVPEWSMAFFGAASIGAIVVPLNAWWTGPELEYGLRDSGSRICFVDGQRAAALAGRVDIPLVAVPRDLDRVPGGTLPPDVRTLADLLGGPVAEDAELADAAPIDPDDDATIFYTSGTTGHAKGALGTHRNLLTNMVTVAYGARRAALRAASPELAAAALARTSGSNSYLLSVPFFHVTGCHSILVPNLNQGGKIVLMHRWDPTRALELMERERITTFGGVPTMAWQVITHPDLDRYDTSTVRSVAYGGAPAPPELLRRMAERFPGRVASNGYGLTETSSVTCTNSGSDYLRKPESVGVPAAVCDVRVVDDDGSVLGAGEIGELWISGPNVVRGYWANPEETAASFVDGWLRTGDVGRVDDEGFVYVVDRAKDLVIRGGENVYCAEVEGAIFEHPAVADVAVVGVPHDVLGEEVGAIVVLRPGTDLSADGLRSFLAGRIAAFKIPVAVSFRDAALPRNASGKILKRELRDTLAAGPAAAPGRGEGGGTRSD